MSFNKLHSKYSCYHFCIVRECKNTSIKTPEKLWIKLPSEISMRNTWLKLAKRDPLSLSTKSQIYFCEDHFDLPNDMENYIRYKIMGSVKKVFLKPNCLPSKFDCQKNSKHMKKQTKQQHRKRLRLSGTQDNKETFVQTSTSSVDQDKEICVPSVSKSTLRGLEGKINRVYTHNTQHVQKCSNVQQVTPGATPEPVQKSSEVKSVRASAAEMLVMKISEESGLSSNILPNQDPMEGDFIKTEPDEVPENVSFYCDEEDASCLEQDIDIKGEEMYTFQCCVCLGTITGFRYTCVQCSDFDLCGACEADNKHQQHYVLRVPSPRPAAEVQSVLAILRLHLFKDSLTVPDLDSNISVNYKHEEDPKDVTVEEHWSENMDTSISMDYTDISKTEDWSEVDVQDSEFYVEQYAIDSEVTAKLLEYKRNMLLNKAKFADTQSEMRKAVVQSKIKKSGIQPEMRLADIQPEKRKSGIQPEMRLADIQPEKRKSGIQPEMRLADIQPEKRKSGIQPEMRLADIQPEKRKACIQPEKRKAGIQPEMRKPSL